MKIKLFSFILCLFFIPFIVAAQRSDTTGSAALFQKIMAGINTKHVSWVKSSAKEVNNKNMTETEVKTKATNYALLGNLKDADIEALSFLVMMQAAKSAQEDLKAIMAKVKSINEQKRKMREAQATMQKNNTGISRVQLDSFKLLLIKKPATTTISRAKPVTKTELQDVVGTMKNDLDSMSEMGETESLRLQMAMDRQSKMMTALSNILKKISDTQGSIVQNLK
jgi:hypothetical protein